MVSIFYNKLALRLSPSALFVIKSSLQYDYVK